MTAEMCVSLNWCPPADLQDQLPVLNAHQRLLGESDISLRGWRPLAVAKLAGEASWGVGVSFDFELIVRNGRFHFRFKLKAVMGEGMGGSVDVELDLDRLDIWLLMVNQAVLDSADDTLEWVQPEARSALAKIGYFIVTAGFEVAALLAHNLQALDDAYDRFTTPERSGIIAYQIVSDDSHDREFRAWVIRLLPEALGALLETLISRSQAFDLRGGANVEEVDALLLQQQAIVKIMKWLIEAAKDGDFDGTHYGFGNSSTRNPAQKLFRNAVISMKDMAMYGVGIAPEQVAPEDINYGSNLGRISNFINNSPDEGDEMQYIRIKDDFYWSKEKLSAGGDL
ncbi:hypothetical protein [Larsenimonas suaedae]|uniref:Uncharacterized protein n=1 Tax=Larsenimonas suaedae TaxID=1851019 RepID=A0ABU1GXE7_9GAMM|nr:hypothetical protein [Larsenimonas suaedae]MCM2973219.1 hypothetical protein [Larsenimonas suaedae]MDR5896112.1 hypothetical protein [Larsenimonas suaedae]